MADRTHLDASRVCRESLHLALVGLEDALSTPLGEGARWRLRVAMAVDHAANRVEEHVATSEAGDGLLNQVVSDAPRLSCRTARLRRDHVHLEQQVHGLKVALSEIADDDVAVRGLSVRDQAMEFLSLLATHRQRGADLFYEAYLVDIGDSA